MPSIGLLQGRGVGGGGKKSKISRAAREQTEPGFGISAASAFERWGRSSIWPTKTRFREGVARDLRLIKARVLINLPPGAPEESGERYQHFEGFGAHEARKPVGFRASCAPNPMICRVAWRPDGRRTAESSGSTIERPRVPSPADYGVGASNQGLHPSCSHHGNHIHFGFRGRCAMKAM
jgi:hypothetical protein